MKIKSIYQFLNQLVEVIKSEELLENYKMNVQDFSRSRVLSFVDVVFILIGKITKTTKVELFQFFNSKCQFKTCSPQALSKAKKKINPALFQFLNLLILDFFYTNKKQALYKGKYNLFAVDGSMIQLPNSDELATVFLRTKNQNGFGMPLARASVFYDLNNNLALDALISHNKHSEIPLFYEHLENVLNLPVIQQDETVVILDRGYANFNIITEIINRNLKFIIRTKSSLSNEIFEFSNSKKEEQTVNIRQTKNANINCRIVKLKLKNGEYEYLLTNTDFDTNELKGLYFKRWGIETFYGYIKSSLQLENFSSKSSNGILLEFHSTIFTANLNQLFIMEVPQENKTINRYHYKVNKNISSGILKHLYQRIIHYKRIPKKLIDAILEVISRSKIPIKPERSFERVKNKRSRKKYHFNKKIAI